jgi:hypothetical protein
LADIVRDSAKEVLAKLTADRLTLSEFVRMLQDALSANLGEETVSLQLSDAHRHYAKAFGLTARDLRRYMKREGR